MPQGKHDSLAACKGRVVRSLPNYLAEGNVCKSLERSPHSCLSVSTRRAAAARSGTGSRRRAGRACWTSSSLSMTSCRSRAGGRSRCRGRWDSSAACTWTRERGRGRLRCRSTQRAAPDFCKVLEAVEVGAMFFFGHLRPGP
jgi:hypothetical protein